MPETFTYDKPFLLESGQEIHGLRLAYTTYGRLNENRDNVAWVFHALTANSDPAEWWPGLVGKGKLLDPDQYFIICVNMPGSCYGSTGPLEINPRTGEPWFHRFPFFTTRDMIRAYRLLKDELGIRRVRIGIGGSMGGQQLLEWAIEEPELFHSIVPIATNAFHSAWGIAFNASQRACIENDGTWNEKHAKAGIEGMKTARGLALLSYRHYETYRRDQTELSAERISGFKSESYQRYQGEKLAARFNAFSYHVLSRSMDAHHVARGRGSVRAALQRIRARTLVIGITTDILFPLQEQQFIAEAIPGAVYRYIYSSYGHDGFLLESNAIAAHVRDVLQNEKQTDLVEEKRTTIINS